jgi:Chalcone isomerase-like
MKRVVLYGLIGAAFASICQAAELGGVRLPDKVTVGQTELRLNGIALRTYSLLFIPIYVAGLYLGRPESTADRILQSDDMKLLDIHFIHDVSQEKAKQAWRDGFSNNCQSPCRLPTDAVDRFLAAVPAMRKGDRFSFLFSARGTDITENGQSFAHIDDRSFAKLILKTFIGPHPPTDRLKQELLGSDLKSASRN